MKTTSARHELKVTHSTVHVCLLHPFDPHHLKIGGLETYIRDFIKHTPRDWQVLVIGADFTGTWTLDRIQKINIYGRDVDFVPIVSYPASQTSHAARRLRRSLTLQFGLAILRRLWWLRRLLRSNGYSVDLRRVEYALALTAMRVPFIQMLHGVGAPTGATESLLAKHKWAHRLMEKISIRYCKQFFCVGMPSARAAARRHPAQAVKIRPIGTWADPDAFAPTAFPQLGTLKLVYVGRLEEVKDPGLMLAVIKALKTRKQLVEFHYVGDGSFEAVSGFSDVKDVIVIHGPANPAGVARVIADCHIGLLCSHFEGMPRSIIETLACGRPVVTTDIPIMHELVNELNGRIVSRRDPDLLAAAVVDVYRHVARCLSPASIAATVTQYTPSQQLKCVYAVHERLNTELTAFRRKAKGMMEN